MTRTKNNNKPIDKTELVWPGKRKEVERVELPFQTIETINLPRGRRQEDIFTTPIQQGKLIDKKEKQLTLSGQDTIWKNRLIWGDNLLIMGSLLKDFAGKINLIYIDPPFATGDDFSFEVQIGDQEITKEPSALEVKAYRDTWGKGMQSYLQMMYDRLVLMKELLADNGSIYVHLDYRVVHYIKTVMDEIFGRDNFINEIIWQCTDPKSNITDSYGKIHQNILFYRKRGKMTFNVKKIESSTSALQEYSYFMAEGGKVIPASESRGIAGRFFKLENITAPRYTPSRIFEWHDYTPKNGWRYSKEKLDELLEQKKILLKDGTASSRCHIKYLDEIEGMPLQSIWQDVGTMKGGRVYETQKPEKLLERIIGTSSNECDLVADFFSGSGTTGITAEKLSRRWLMTDLGRFAIHTTRKRLLDIKAKPFVIQNLGKYERHRWVQLNGRYTNYLKFILELYHAEPVEGFTNLHGKKDKAFVRIGAVDAPVTLSEIREALSECKENKIKSLDVLGWEWEMGLHDLIEEEAERYGVKLSNFWIPREVMELNVSDPKLKEDIRFYELAYLEVESKVKDKKATITLKDFIIPNPELLPEEVKDKVKNWSDFIDYWAVDWMFNQHEEETEEDDTFHNMNQQYRTRKEPKLELLMDYTYPKAGKYNILVKVIDIFGNDTTKLVAIKI